MTFRRLLCSSPASAVAAISVLAALAPACSGSNDPTPPGQAGSGGTAGGSGASGAAAGGSASGAGGKVNGGGMSAGGGGAGNSGGSAGGSAGGAAGAGGGSAGTGGGGAGGGGAGGGSGGSAGGVLCPSDATFCSSFEENALPAKAVYKYNAAPGEWTRDFEVDTTVFKSGKSSLRVKSGSADTTASGAYQMLAVPAPEGTFWVRLYIQQTEQDIGEIGHNVFGGASDTDEPNAPVMIEMAEDVGLAFNTSDSVRWPANYGRINGAEMPFKLPKGMWHCIEIQYDGTKKEQKLFVNGTQQIDAMDYPSMVANPIKIFKFGFNKLHGPARKIWYDDVAVGPTRAGCL